MTFIIMIMMPILGSYQGMSTTRLKMPLCDWCCLQFWPPFNSIWHLCFQFNQCLAHYINIVLLPLVPTYTNLLLQCNKLQPIFSSILTLIPRWDLAYKHSWQNHWSSCTLIWIIVHFCQSLIWPLLIRHIILWVIDPYLEYSIHIRDYFFHLWHETTTNFLSLQLSSP